MRRIAYITVTFATLASMIGACGKPHTNGASVLSAATFYKDIKPLIEQKCQVCHVEGGIGPFALKTLDDVKTHSAAIKAAVGARTMPPWLAKPGCANYAGDRSLSDSQIAAISDWVDGGSEAGAEGDYVAPEAAKPTGLSRVDATIKIPAPYTPSRDKGPDDYRCFIIDWTATEAKFVSGFRANPGNAALVHHVIAYVASSAESIKSFQDLDAAEPGLGYTCFGGPGAGLSARWLAAWAPGGQGSDFPARTGIKIPVGSKIILQVHYNLSHVAADASDQTSLDFKLDDSVDKEAMLLPWTNPDWVRGKTMTIPANTADVKHSWAFDPTPFMGIITGEIVKASFPFSIWSAGLHMHTHGTSARLVIQRGTTAKEECMVDIPNWDFHWQGGYGFVEPKIFLPGDKLYLECHFNNSGSDKVRNWGEGTDDEMCLGSLYLTR